MTLLTLPSDLGVVKKSVVTGYQNDRTLLSILFESTDFGIEIVFEIHLGEPREKTQVYFIEILSATTADTREPVQLNSNIKQEAIRVISDWVEENQSYSGDYRDF